jgi:CheY-like chemotaxis protein
MKILVIDDSDIHVAAAQAQLKDHDVRVASTYDEGRDLLVEMPNKFDVVLVDLLMPPSGYACGSRPEWKEMPVGIFLALLAAKNGARYVAVFTDSDHHSHPASACFDVFKADDETGRSVNTPFMVEGAELLLTNNPNWVKIFYREDLSKVMEWDEYHKDEERAKQITVRAKDWREPLNFLLNG